jgi:hypothetical protein
LELVAASVLELVAASVLELVAASGSGSGRQGTLSTPLPR